MITLEELKKLKEDLKTYSKSELFLYLLDLSIKLKAVTSLNGQIIVPYEHIQEVEDELKASGFSYHIDNKKTTLTINLNEI